MNKNKTSRRLKMFGAIIFAYIIVAVGSPQVFLANSPKIRPDVIARMRIIPQTALAMAQHPFDADARRVAIEEAQIGSNVSKEDLPYQPIAPGVYAAEDPETKERYVKIEKGTRIEVRYVTLSDGRRVKVYVPAE